MTHVAVIDIGKTNAKLALVDRSTLEEIAVLTRPNRVRPGPPWPHFDLDGHWEFLLDALRDLHARFGIDAISITAHGASVVLLDGAGALAAPMLDYEYPGPDDLAEEYAALRPAFAETGSPPLAGGLNVGAQLHWMFARDPGLLDRTAKVLTYPQYWTWRLTGVAATEPTSLGCHTDLWLPREGRWSPLVDRLGLSGKMAAVRRPDAVLGPVLRSVAARTGLGPETPVVCGIHDSNASLLPHLLSRSAPFSVVSTGTWIVTMSVGGAEVALDAARDTLLNVDARGNPVPSARFMGGRECEIAAPGNSGAPSTDAIARALDGGALMLPSLAPETGPFRGRHGGWMGGAAPDNPTLAHAAAHLYCALVTSVCLRLTGHRGEIVVEGPFARSHGFLAMLAAASGSPVLASSGQTGTSKGAALLVDGPEVPIAIDTRVAPDEVDNRFAACADRWKTLIEESGT